MPHNPTCIRPMAREQSSSSAPHAGLEHHLWWSPESVWSQESGQQPRQPTTTPAAFPCKCGFAACRKVTTRRSTSNTYFPSSLRISRL